MQQMFNHTNLNTIDGMFENCHNLSITSIGTILQFKNVRGGATSNGIGWFKADSVIAVKRNES